MADDKPCIAELYESGGLDMELVGKMRRAKRPTSSRMVLWANVNPPTTNKTSSQGV